MNEEKILYPICPFCIYFEGDEDICNEKLCDYDVDARMCFMGCKIDKILKRQKKIKNANQK